MKKQIMEFKEKYNNIMLAYYEYLLIDDYSRVIYMDFLIKLINKMELPEEYINSISFDYIGNDHGYYLPEKKKIVFDIKNIESNLKSNDNRTECVIKYLISALHEINHVYQYNYMNSYKDVYTSILKESDTIKSNKPNIFDKYHMLFPAEVDSNVKAIYFLYDFLSFNKILTLEIEEILVDNLCRSVNPGNYVTLSSYNKLCELLKIKPVNYTYSKLSDFDCLTYGLKKSYDLIDKIENSRDTGKMLVDIQRKRV